MSETTTTTPAAPATETLAAPALDPNILGTPAAAPDAPAAPETPTEPAAPEPVTYTDFKLPDGIAKDDAFLGAFSEVASKSGLKQDVAQSVIDAVAPKLAEALNAPLRAWETMQTEWQTAVKTDPEIGKDNFPVMRATIAKVLDNPALSDPGLREALNITGAGNNPAVIRTLYRMSKALTEGGGVAAGNPAAQPKNPADVLYPSQV